MSKRPNIIPTRTSFFISSAAKIKSIRCLKRAGTQSETF